MSCVKSAKILNKKKNAVLAHSALIVIFQEKAT